MISAVPAADLSSTVWSDKLGGHFGVVVAIAVTVLAALILRWLIRILVNRVVRTFTDRATKKRSDRGRAGREREETTQMVVERTAARARVLAFLPGDVFMDECSEDGTGITRAEIGANEQRT